MDATGTPADSLLPHEPPSAAPVGRPSRPWGAVLLWLVLTGAVLAALGGVLVALARIDNNPENFTHYGRPLSALAWLCDLVVIAACGALWGSRSAPTRRAARFAVIAVAAMYALRYAPVYFGLHRYLLALLGLVAAARLAMAPPLDLLETPGARGPSRLAAVLLACAFALATEVMISIKLSSLGWAFAVD